MKWFRSNIRQGARLALLALSIQFVLSFGHFHAIAPAQAAASLQHAPGSIESSIAAHFENASRGQPRPDDSDQAADLCAICAVVAMVNTATPAPALPPLPLPDAVGLIYRPTGHTAPLVDIGRVLFQPRAPPIL
nr:DUF2946 domain-containing protein [Bradyrhizobium tropiciagri]